MAANHHVVLPILQTTIKILPVKTVIMSREEVRHKMCRDAALMV